MIAVMLKTTPVLMYLIPVCIPLYPALILRGRPSHYLDPGEEEEEDGSYFLLAGDPPHRQPVPSIPPNPDSMVFFSEAAAAACRCLLPTRWSSEGYSIEPEAVSSTMGPTGMGCAGGRAIEWTRVSGRE